MHSPLHECYKFHSKAVWQSHPYIIIAHTSTFQSLNASSMYIFQLPWYFKIQTDYWKYRSLHFRWPHIPMPFSKSFWIASFFNAPHSQGLKGPQFRPLAQANWGGEVGDSSKLSLSGKVRTGTLLASSSGLPQPSSCCLQLEIIHVNRMRIELLIKKLRGKMFFSSFNLSRVGFPVPVSFSNLMIHTI